MKLDFNAKRSRNSFIAGIIFMLSMAACTPLTATPIIIDSTPTPSVTPTSTATVVWFPPTDTPTPFPTQAVTPTSDLRLGIGEVLLTDDFSESGDWVLGRTAAGSAALGKNELSIVVTEPRAYVYAVRTEPAVGDFYAEVTANPTLCKGADEYGLLVRYNSPVDFYRFSLSCDGKVRLDRLVNGKASSPQPPLESASVPPGAPSFSRLAVWASGQEMRFFINDQHQFSVKDPLLLKGNLGLFARSGGETDLTVSFSDLTVRSLSK